MNPSLLVKDPNDEKVFEKVRWVARLSNGETIYESSEQDWKTLGQYIKDNKKLRIDQLYLQFRSHIVNPLQPSAEGYFLMYQLEKDGFDGPVKGSYIIGTIDVQDDMIYASRWSIPELEWQDNCNRKFIEQFSKFPESCIL